MPIMLLANNSTAVLPRELFGVLPVAAHQVADGPAPYETDGRRHRYFDLPLAARRQNGITEQTCYR